MLQTNATKQQDYFNQVVAPRERRLVSAKRTKRLIERQFDQCLDELNCDLDNRVSSAVEQAENFTMLKSESIKDWRAHHMTIQQSNEKLLRQSELETNGEVLRKEITSGKKLKLKQRDVEYEVHERQLKLQSRL